MTGKQLREWREAEGLNQHELATRLGVHPSTIYNNEVRERVTNQLEALIREIKDSRR